MHPSSSRGLLHASREVRRGQWAREHRPRTVAARGQPERDREDRRDREERWGRAEEVMEGQYERSK